MAFPFRATATLVLLPPALASAQTMMSTSTLDLGMMQTQQNSMLFQSINSANATADAAMRDSRRPTRDDPVRSLERPGVTWGATANTFRAVAPSLMPHQLAQQFGRDARHKAVLEQYFAQTLADYRAIARQRGRRPNDVSLAASFVVATCYDVLHGEGTLKEADMVALRAHLAWALPRDRKFQSFDDRRKQETFERFAILGMHLGGLRLKAEQTRDPALMRVATAMASRQLEDMFGVPAAHIRIDRRGLTF